MLYSNYYLQKNIKPNNKFIIWINSVEQMVLEHFKLYLLDIPDEDYMYFFENKFEPSEMVQIIQESNGFDSISYRKITKVPINKHKNKKQKTSY